MANTLVNPIEPGTVLADKYRVERILGQGGMGVVVEAKHLALDERVALKFLLPEYATQPEAAARFQREARAAAKIKSEHVARVSDVGTFEHNVPYMVMEYLDGRDLRAVLETAGVLTLTDAVDYVIQACEAIAEAHSYGIVHRDLKPANLFLTRRANGTPQVKVLDFGISKVTTGGIDNLTKTSTAVGSALYMSPEQMQATRGVDHRTDIYALGISLYELLAGKQPFYADTLPQLCAEVFTGLPTAIRTMRPDLPEQFAVVLEKAYARDRAQRYQSIAEMVIALAPFAPPRSGPVIESVARLAGLEVPAPGMPWPVFAPTVSVGPLVTTAAATRDAPAGGSGTAGSPATGSGAASSPAAGSGAAGSPAPGSPAGPRDQAASTPASLTGQPIASGQPATLRSLATPEGGMAQSANPVVVVSAPDRAASKVPLFAAIAVAVVVLSGTATFLAIRPGATSQAGAPTQTAAPPTQSPTPLASADKTGPTAAADAPGAQPTAPGTAITSAVPAVPAVASTAPAVASATPTTATVTHRTGGPMPRQPGAKPPPATPPSTPPATPPATPGKRPDVGF